MGRYTNRHFGFSLVETLTIFGMMIVLAIVLLPVFTQTRERSYQGACMGHQRELVAAMTQYAQDHDGEYPTAGSVWRKLPVDRNLLTCPTAGQATANAYVFNGALAGHTVELAMAAFPGLSAKAIPVTADGLTDTSSTIDNIAQTADDYLLRHAGGKLLVASFLDGHVAALSAPPTVAIAGVTWVNTVGTLGSTPTPGKGSTLTKILPDNLWNTADAVSKETLAGNGCVQFSFGQNDKDVVVGLSRTNPDRNFASIDYAIFGAAQGAIQVYEQGIVVFGGDLATRRPYTAKDVFSIERQGKQIIYRQNGQEFYRSSTPSTARLMVDTSFMSSGAAITNVGLFTATD